MHAIAPSRYEVQQLGPGHWAVFDRVTRRHVWSALSYAVPLRVAGLMGRESDPTIRERAHNRAAELNNAERRP